MTTAAILIRVSTTEQSEKNISVPAQKSRNISFCNSKDWSIYDFYIDDGYSGKDLNRPDMQRLIKDAGEKKFDVVVVWKLDRLSRRQRDILYLIEDVFLANGIDIASVTENLDTSTAMGRAMVSIMGTFAQLERETIVERTKMGKEEAARQGRFFGGKAILGYTSKDKRLIVDPIGAEVIRKIFRLYLDGNGYGPIAAQLNAEKVPTPRGNSYWFVATVARLLQNPTYAGYIEHLGTLHKGKHDPIISKDEWNRVQKLIAQNRYRFGVKEPPTMGILRGIVYCGECGARMRAKKASGRKKARVQYVCYSRDGRAPHMVKDENCPSRYIEAYKLEYLVIEKLLTYSQNPGIIVDETNKKNDKKPSNDNAVASAKTELQAVTKTIKKYQDAFESSDDMDMAEFRERVKELRERRQYLEAFITENQQKPEKKAAISRHSLSLLKNLPTAWNLSNDEEKQKLIYDIIKKVTVFRDGSIDLELM